MRRLCLFVCLCLAAPILFARPSGLVAADWPQFRGPNGDGVSDAKGVPTAWSESENVRWKTAIHDKGWSSPVVLGDQVWMTTATKDGKQVFAVCVDRKSGKIVHDVKVFDVEKPTTNIDYNSFATPTPVVEPGRVYVHFGSAGTACLDTATGKTLWEQRGLKCDHWRGPGSSPVVYGDLIILTFDGFDAQYLAALKKSDGSVAWRKDRNLKYSTDNGDYKKAFATPAVVKVNGKDQVVSPSAEATVAYDPLTGDEVWRVIHGGMNAASRPVARDGLVYLTSGHTKQLLAVKLGGTGDITKDVEWKTSKGVPTRPSLLLANDLLFAVSDEGIATCTDPKTGKQHWQERLKGPHDASPLFIDGLVYFFDQQGKATIVEAKPTFKVVATNELAEGCLATPAVTDGCLFVRTKTHLYCIAKPE